MGVPNHSLPLISPPPIGTIALAMLSLFRFTPLEGRILLAFEEALVADGFAPLSEEGRRFFLHVCEKLAGGLDRFVRFALRILLLALEVGPFVLSDQLRSFSDLPKRQRVSFLWRWSQTRAYQLRLIFLGLKSLVAMALCSVPEAEREMGYDPACHLGSQR